jgi:hypothetical protein
MKDAVPAGGKNAVAAKTGFQRDVSSQTNYARNADFQRGAMSTLLRRFGMSAPEGNPDVTSKGRHV